MRTAARRARSAACAILNCSLLAATNSSFFLMSRLFAAAGMLRTWLVNLSISANSLAMSTPGVAVEFASGAAALAAADDAAVSPSRKLKTQSHAGQQTQFHIRAMQLSRTQPITMPGWRPTGWLQRGQPTLGGS